MNNRATVIILPPSVPEGVPFHRLRGDPIAAFGVLQSTLHRVLACQLPMVLVAPKAINDQARHLLPHNCLVDMPETSATDLTPLAQAVATGVHASSQAAGWLVLPGDMPMLQADTLQLVSRAVQTYPIAYPQYRARRGHPMGFGRELFSELIHLDIDRDLYRLTSRYPAEGIDVDDPGVLMHSDTAHQDALEMTKGTPFSRHAL
ncbi:MAG: NTP transferase domain-containing protein [Aquabacterium sp.]|uniref:nucleotidyltransferase family protein n=1 Tax=Aquabacterium sp. TaxID=1872578 RepID=UPI0025BF98BC|nr:NTP transferase domain-containing protein [Aquabacterium sp.]MBI5924924.1 NTP transferase domain-containing protein [Aquabacterium sp.]